MQCRITINGHTATSGRSLFRKPSSYGRAAKRDGSQNLAKSIDNQRHRILTPATRTPDQSFCANDMSSFTWGSVLSDNAAHHYGAIAPHSMNSVLSPNAAVFVPAAAPGCGGAPPATCTQAAALASTLSSARRRRGRVGSQPRAPAEREGTRQQPSAIKKQKPPSAKSPTKPIGTDSLVTAPTSSAHNAAPAIRLSGVKFVRSKSDRARLLALAKEVCQSLPPSELASPPSLPVDPLTEPASAAPESACGDDLCLKGVPLTRSAASELALVLNTAPTSMAPEAACGDDLYLKGLPLTRSAASELALVLNTIDI